MKEELLKYYGLNAGDKAYSVFFLKKKKDNDQ